MDYQALKKEYDFDIYYEEIKRKIWEFSRDNIFNAMKALKHVIIPYCKENNYIDNNISSESNHKRRKETKSWDFFIYEQSNEGMTVVAHTSSCHTYLYFLLEHPKYEIEECVGWEEKEIAKIEDLQNTILIVVTLNSKYSDDEYVEARQTAVTNVIEHIAKNRKHRYYNLMLWNSYACKRDESKVEIHERVNTRHFETGGLKDGWDKILFEISCDLEYLD